MTSDGPREADDARAERAGVVARWCEECAVPWRSTDLSDLAAVLVAAGRADPRTRGVVLVRARAGVGMPAIGDYTGLRADAERLRRWEAEARASGGRTRSLVYSGRADGVRRRVQALRSSVVSGLVVHSGGVRGVRRERREGVHLTLEQRENLFSLLCWTPAPVAAARSRTVEIGQAALADAAASVSARYARRGSSRTAAGTVPSVLGRIERWARGAEDARSPEPLRFRDPYETAVYLAGRYVDAIRGAGVWNSDAFAPYRVRVDLPDELVRFASDAAELQSLRAELAAARAASSGSSARAEVDARMRALRPVRAQLLDRLVSLDRIAASVSRAAVGARARDAAVRAASLDGRIEELVGRAGGHEFVTEDLHRVGSDADPGRDPGPGGTDPVAREIEELTSRRD